MEGRSRVQKRVRVGGFVESHNRGETFTSSSTRVSSIYWCGSVVGFSKSRSLSRFLSYASVREKRQKESRVKSLNESLLSSLWDISGTDLKKRVPSVSQGRVKSRHNGLRSYTTRDNPRSPRSYLLRHRVTCSKRGHTSRQTKWSKRGV